MMYRNVGKEAGIMMIMLAAREYGIGPAQALNGGLHIIEGKVELSARMMSALIRRAKHTLQILESNDRKCTIRGRRHDTNEIHTVTFTIEEAQQAGLIKDKGGWKKNPIDMLYARAVSRLARQLFSDVIGIGYIEGEISDPGANMEVLEPSQDMDYNQESVLEDVLAMLNDGLQDGLAIAMNFVEAISKHYGWTNDYTACMLMEKPEVTVIKFKEWKIKQVLKNNKKDNVVTLEDVSHL
jgi:hypothetical protein